MTMTLEERLDRLEWVAGLKRQGTSPDYYPGQQLISEDEMAKVSQKEGG